MHARFALSELGRFPSFDPFGGTLGAPQSWKRYAHAMGNPINLVDPTPAT